MTNEQKVELSAFDAASQIVALLGSRTEHGELVDQIDALRVAAGFTQH